MLDNNNNNLSFWTGVLKITSYEVTRHVESKSAHEFSIAPCGPVYCPHCGGCGVRVQKRPTVKDIRDLSICGKVVNLTIRRDQFSCQRCDRRFTPYLDMLEPSSWVTRRFMRQAAEQIRYSDVASTARMLDLPERSLGRWYNQYLESLELDVPPQNRKPIKAIGIDELALKKRHRQFVAVIVDHTNGCVLEVLETRLKEDVKASLERLKKAGLFADLEEVSCDMWPAYANAARETFGSEVKVCVDRFHVMKAFQDQLTDARREIQKNLTPEEKVELKGSRWLWTTNWENLTLKSRRLLEALKRRFPRLGTLHDQREKLRAIFETEHSVEDGKALLLKWVEQSRALGLKSLNAFCETLGRWLEGIVQYFYKRTTNGRTEGFNRGLRSILWRACGMQNFQNFRLRVLHCFGARRTEIKNIVN